MFLFRALGFRRIAGFKRWDFSSFSGLGFPGSGVLGSRLLGLEFLDVCGFMG